MKKLLCIALACLLLLACTAGAEGEVGFLFDKAKELAFDTSNVTLGAEATFTYDGEWFKTLHATYKQDSDRSYLSYMLDTPRANGSVYNGGYTVVGIENTAYYAETYYGNVVYSTSCTPDTTVLTGDNRTEQMLAVARTLAVFGENIIGLNGENGVYTFEIGDLPEVVDRGIYFLVLDYIQTNYYLDLFHLYNYESYNTPEIYYEDYDALFNAKYEALYGTSYDVEEDDYSRYEVIDQALSLLVQEISSAYTDGYVYIRADGSYDHFEQLEELYRAMDYVWIDFEDYDGFVKNYYEQMYGETLDDETYDLIYYSPNYELWEQMEKFTEEMQNSILEEARRQNPDAVYAYAAQDGTVTASDTLPSDEINTVTRHILNHQTFAELKSLSCSITTQEDLLTGFEGEAVIAVTEDEEETTHTLNIRFALTAGDYGTTHVNEEFDAAEYGLTMYEDYEQQLEQESLDYDAYWDNLVENAPEKVTFCGKEFETQMELYAVEAYDEETEVAIAEEAAQG